MTLTAYERAQMRARWRQLVRAAGQADLDELNALRKRAPSWASPIEAPAGAFVLFGLVDTATAYVKATVAERAKLAGLLKLHAEVAGDILDASYPSDRSLLEPRSSAAPPDPTRLPFRRDIDG